MESEHAAATTATKDPARDRLLGNITKYLGEIGEEEVRNSGGLQLLRAVGEYFVAQCAREEKQEKEEGSPVLAALKTIEDRLNRFENRSTKAAPSNYAAAAGKGNREAVDLTGQRKQSSHITHTPTAKDILAEQRKTKELIVRIANAKEKEDVQQTATKDLVEKIQEKAIEVVGISRLPSGDIKVFTRTKETKETLEKDTEWTKTVAESADISRRTYGVTAHGVKVRNIDTANQAQAIEHLYRCNACLHANLKITKVSWLARAIKEKKAFSSLRIEVETPDMANRLISQGLLEKYEMKQYKRFSGEGRITQCFKCQRYGHVAKSCRNEITCGHCAENHHSEDCTHKTTPSRRKCVVCLCSGHEAWSPICESRKDQKLKAKKAYEGRPAVYDIVQAPTEKATSPIDKPTEAQVPQSKDINMISELTRAPYTVVTNKKRPREARSNSPKASDEESRERHREDSFAKIMQSARSTDAFQKGKPGRPKAAIQPNSSKNITEPAKTPSIP